MSYAESRVRKTKSISQIGSEKYALRAEEDFSVSAMDDLVFGQPPALPLQNNIHSGKAGEKKSFTYNRKLGGMAWGDAVYGYVR